MEKKNEEEEEEEEGEGEEKKRKESNRVSLWRVWTQEAKICKIYRSSSYNNKFNTVIETHLKIKESLILSGFSFDSFLP